MKTDAVTVFGPASLSNLGPGFDALGLCLKGVGDRVTAWLTDTPGVVIVPGDEHDVLPRDPASNTAAVAAAAVLRKARSSQGIALKVEKGIRLGSGIGGSAASAVAGAWAANRLLGVPFEKTHLVEAVLEGETVASGSIHGDNVLPALFGGLVLVSPSQPTYYRRIILPHHLSIALIQPDVEVFTREARALLPKQVPLADAIQNAAALAFLVDAFREGDWQAVGRLIMQDNLVEPVRARLLSSYEPVRQAALDVGAYGCALSGSGPAMFAIAESPTLAQSIVEAMQEAARESGILSTGFVTEVGDGVQAIRGKEA